MKVLFWMHKLEILHIYYFLYASYTFYQSICLYAYFMTTYIEINSSCGRFLTKMWYLICLQDPKYGVNLCLHENSLLFLLYSNIHWHLYICFHDSYHLSAMFYSVSWDSELVNCWIMPQGKHWARGLRASCHIFVKWLMHNFLLCVFLFRDTLYDTLTHWYWIYCPKQYT